ncbi:hypothetical protein F5148DRAFT_115990 [Russula earlei]|uniref:Uncharacterized protein n=1 Tax=Russula earlei TaxID=71964 RepID=A0ACC0U8D9_9AGAM|nr:hypothetical protein F5148DRAFT_115990 [Russula earlei]
MLDSSFLVATLLVVVTLLFYILYWNRFLAFLAGVVFRVVFWNRAGSSAWIQIGSFHVSLLAGRILLKDFCYHSSNQTIKIVKVQLRWQYWVRSLTRSEDMHAHGGGEDPKSSSGSQSQRCRFHATFEGFEWFMYNRTAAFDNIVSQMEVKTPVPERRAQSFSADGAASQLRHFLAKSSAGGDSNVRTSQWRNPLSFPKFLRSFL